MSKKTKDIPLPCPACGVASVTLSRRRAFGPFVACDSGECLLTGPVCESEQAAIAAWNGLPRRLVWQKTPPWEPGYYWYVAQDLGLYGIVFYDGEGNFRSPCGPEEFILYDAAPFLWAGPIPEPVAAS